MGGIKRGGAAATNTGQYKKWGAAATINGQCTKWGAAATRNGQYKKQGATATRNGQYKKLGCCRNENRSEEHTSELQSLTNLVCRLLLEKKKKKYDSKSLCMTFIKVACR